MMNYYHVDVFAEKPLAGNGLTVIFPEKPISTQTMQDIAAEFKQYESAFIFPPEQGVYPVRIFTVQEELEFAGHPLIGSAALLHELNHADEEQALISLSVAGRTLKLESRREKSFYSVQMNQGRTQTICTSIDVGLEELASWFSLKRQQIDESLPLSVMSNGLSYLYVPVRKALEKIHICVPDLEKRIEKFGARFVYFFDPETLECRTWDNTGIYEDVATGSAAGPFLGYLVQNGCREKNTNITLSQGRFLNRPSKISGSVNDAGEVRISGSVALFAKGVVCLD